MKKFLSGIIAIVFAVSAFALPKLSKTYMDYHWYKRDSPNHYSADVVGPNPSSGCTTGNTICAKGFDESQTASAINDLTPGDTPDRKVLVQ